MIEHHLLDFYAFDLCKPGDQFLGLAFVAVHLQDDQAPWRADMLINLVQPDPSLDIAAVFSKRLLYGLDLVDTVIDVDAENYVFCLHGMLLRK